MNRIDLEDEVAKKLIEIYDDENFVVSILACLNSDESLQLMLRYMIQNWKNINRKDIVDIAIYIHQNAHS